MLLLLTVSLLFYCSTLVLGWIIVSPCLLMAIRTMSGKFGSDVCWKKKDWWMRKCFPCRCACCYFGFSVRSQIDKTNKKMQHNASYNFHLLYCDHPYLYFEERTAKRWPAANCFQKCHLGLINSHTSLFVVKGNNTLWTKQKNKKYCAFCDTIILFNKKCLCFYCWN